MSLLLHPFKKMETVIFTQCITKCCWLIPLKIGAAIIVVLCAVPIILEIIVWECVPIWNWYLHIAFIVIYVPLAILFLVGLCLRRPGFLLAYEFLMLAGFQFFVVVVAVRFVHMDKSPGEIIMNAASIMCMEFVFIYLLIVLHSAYLELRKEKEEAEILPP